MNRASTIPMDSTAATSSSNSSQGKASTNVQVAVRCRPPNTEEKKTSQPLVVTNDQDARTVAASYGPPGKKFTKNFAFDKVFGMYSTQEEVFKGIVKPIVQEVLEGFNCTIFAYGQTGTGKTHTMQGDIHCEENAGIVPRAVKDILEQLEDSGVEFTIRVSFLELYNEELQDLLSTNTTPMTGNGAAAPGPPGLNNLQNAPKLKLCEDSKKGTVVCQGLEEVTVLTVKDIFDILERGIQQRQTAETLCNKNSSRSHSIFTLKINIREYNPDGEEVVRHGQLNLVDLAGSECIGRSGAKNDRAREAGTINQSLLSLGRVITALVDHHMHIPYRDSKLTRLLQDSLGGKAKTCIIATFSPCNSAIEETLSTLDYASRAKNIKNQPQQNQKMTKKVVLKEYCAEIEQLRYQLQITREKNGIYVEPETYYAMEAKVTNQEAQLTECEGALKRMGDEVKVYKAAKEDLEAELEQTKSTLSSTTEQLQAKTCECAVVRGELSAKVRALAASDAVVHEQIVSEAQLHNEGSSLISEVKERRGDIDALLGKVDRFTDKERERVAQTAAFLHKMQSTQQDLMRGVTNLSTHCDHHAASLCDGVQKMLVEGKNSCALLKGAIDKALSELLSTSRDATGSMSDSCERLAGDLQAVSAHVASTLTELQSQLSSWLGDVDCHIAQSNQQLKMQQSEIEALQSVMSGALSSQLEFIAAFVAENNTHSAQCVTEVEQLRGEVCSKMQDFQTKNAEFLQAQSVDFESKASTMKQQFADMVDALVQSNSTAATERKAAMQAHCDETASIMASGTQRVSTHMHTMATNATSALSDRMPTMLKEASTTTQKHMGSIDDLRGAAASSCSTVGSSVAARRQQLDETVKSLVVKVQDSVQNQSITAVQQTAATAKALQGKVEDTTSVMEQSTTTSLTEFNKLLHGEGSALEVELKAHFSVVGEYCNDSMNASVLPALDSTVTSYATQMSHAVLKPTGSTPQKAACAANNSRRLPALTSTREHDIIRTEVYEGKWVQPNAVAKVSSAAVTAANSVAAPTEVAETEENADEVCAADTTNSSSEMQLESSAAEKSNNESAATAEEVAPSADVSSTAASDSGDVDADEETESVAVPGRPSTDSVGSTASDASSISTKSKRSSTSSVRSTASNKRKFGNVANQNQTAAATDDKSTDSGAVAKVSKIGQPPIPATTAAASEASVDGNDENVAANPFAAAVTTTATKTTRSARSGIAKPSTRAARGVAALR